MITAIGPIETRIREKLVAALAPIHLEVENDSDRHAGPPGRETHFKVLVVSAKFEGMSRVARQRFVNEVLGEELRDGVHALQQKTLAPAEWQASGQAAFPSTPCQSHAKK